MKLAIIQGEEVLLEMQQEEITKYVASYLKGELKLSRRDKARLEELVALAFVQAGSILKNRTVYT